MKIKPAPGTLNAAGVTLIYAGFATLWIIASGYLLSYATSDPAIQERIEMAKGLVFVAVSSCLLYLLLKVWREPAGGMTTLEDKPGQAIPRTQLILFFILMALLIPLIGMIIYKLYSSEFDRDDLLVPLQNLIFWFSLVAFTTFAAASAAILLLWRQQRHIQQLRLARQKEKSDRMLGHFYDMPFIGMAMLTAVSRDWVRCNDRLCDILGHTRPELYQTRLEQLIHPDNATAYRTGLEALTGGVKDDLTLRELRLLRKDGTTAIVNMDVDCVRRDDGDVDYHFVLVHDITRRKLAEVARQESEQRYRTIVESSPDIIFINRGEHVDFINRAGLGLLGAARTDQIIGRPVYEFFDPLYHTQIRERIDELMQGPRTLPLIEEKMIALDGSVIDVEVVATSYLEAGELLIQVIGRDIRQRKRAEAELLALNRELEQRVQDRTASLVDSNRQLERMNLELESYSYSVSHDLRAPLRGITGFADILRRRYREILPEEAQHHLDNIIEGGERMNRLIDDLLAYARIGRRAITLEDINLGELLRELCDDISDRAGEAGVRLELPDSTGLPMVNSNRTLLHQVLINLLNNALTYHRPDAPGGPRIRIAVEQTPASVDIHVEDNGIGIDPAYHEKIFDIFQRLHSDEVYSGTGIGLAIVSKSVNLLGGDITVRSVPGTGSTFIVQLPGAGI